jgi:hypothetical protein
LHWTTARPWAQHGRPGWLSSDLRGKRPKFPSGAESRLGVTIASWFSQRDLERNVVFAGGDLSLQALSGV